MPRCSIEPAFWFPTALKLVCKAAVDALGPEACGVKTEGGVIGDLCRVHGRIDLIAGPGDLVPVEPSIAEVEFPVAAGSPLGAEAEFGDGSKILNRLVADVRRLCQYAAGDRRAIAADRG